MTTVSEIFADWYGTWTSDLACVGAVNNASIQVVSGGTATDWSGTLRDPCVVF